MMTSICRALLCLCLATVLLATGVVQAMAGIAMAQRAGLSSIVICAENGPQLMIFGSDGEPVPAIPMDPCQKCPACVLHPAFDGSDKSAPIAIDMRATRISPPFHYNLPVSRLMSHQNARGPPR